MSLLQQGHARIRGLGSATFFGLLLVGLLAGCGSGGSSSGSTTGPTTQATATPAIQSIPPTVAVVGKTLTYDVDAIDADSTALTYSLAVAPAGMNIVPATGVITWTPQATQVGDSTVSITASDGLNSRTQTFVLSVFGVTQELASVPISSATGGTVTVNSPTSSLNGLTLTFPPNSLPGDATIRVSELTTSSTLAGGQPGVLRGISLEPDGLVLNSPVTVSIPFDPAELSAGGGIVLPDFLGVFFLDPHTGQNVFQDTFRVDTVQNILVGTLDHFSAYWKTATARLCPPPIGVSPELLCPSTYTDTDLSSKYLPALVVHGHIAFGISRDAALRGMGDETTWGDLRSLLLLHRNNDPQDRVKAWRFDYNSRDVSFRKTALDLFLAISRIKRATNQPAVNIVAHSFGGILTRTYLQGMASADGTGNPAWPLLAYQDNVNKLMTLGTPHQGIGSALFGDHFSVGLADECAVNSRKNFFPTCFEVATALRNGLIDVGKGALLLALNSTPLPPLKSTELPQYQVIIGQQFRNGLTNDGLAGDDGLITIAGADICLALGGTAATAAVGDGSGCSNITNISVRRIASSPSEAFALCHTDVVADCGGPINVPMAAVNNMAHPSWSIIREFLTTVLPADTAPSPVVSATLTVSTPSHGIVVSDLAGIQCGATCVANFDNGTTVTLSPFPDSGFTFSGWSGACVNKVGPCKLAINGNTSVQAHFAPQLSPPPSYRGTWSPAGSMAISRVVHTATRLLNGKVLVVGGLDSPNSQLPSAELYDPAANSGTGAWTPTGSLAIGRERHTATRLLNGKVLVVGGLGSSGSPLASAELYDPAANGGAGAWTPAGNLATGRMEHTATLLPNGKVLVAGGGSSFGGDSLLAGAELYDPAANGGAGAWTPTGSLATVRFSPTATRLLNGKVLVVGGVSNGALPTSAELYDPAANGGAGAWTPAGNLAIAGRYQHTATLLQNGKVLVVGGGGHFGALLDSAELYDPAANGGAGAWSETGSLLATRAQHTATLLPNGKVLVVGGGVNGNPFGDSSAELYDPAANGGAGAWTPTGSLATGRRLPTASLLLNGKVLVVGGENRSGVLASAELFQ